METNVTNKGMNIEEYEDPAVRKSKIAKGAAIGAGGIGVAAAATGTTYAATHENEDAFDGPINADEMVRGAEVGNEIEATPEPEPQSQPTTQYVYVEKPAPAPEPESEPEVTWDETTNYYMNDDKVMSVEEGTVDGHKFMLVDQDADGHADLLAIDINDNGKYEDNEVVHYTPADHVHMGHETAHTSDERYTMDPWDANGEGGSRHVYAYEDNREPIHNNFEDEKTGEEYHDDFAEHNPDYNPHADIDYGNGQYLAENYGYDENSDGENMASLDVDSDEPSVEPRYDMADNDDMDSDSFDSMMDSDEFLG